MVLEIHASPTWRHGPGLAAQSVSCLVGPQIEPQLRLPIRRGFESRPLFFAVAGQNGLHAGYEARGVDDPAVGAAALIGPPVQVPEIALLAEIGIGKSIAAEVRNCATRSAAWLSVAVQGGVF